MPEPLIENAPAAGEAAKPEEAATDAVAEAAEPAEQTAEVAVQPAATTVETAAEPAAQATQSAEQTAEVAVQPAATTVETAAEPAAQAAQSAEQTVEVAVQPAAMTVETAAEPAAQAAQSAEQTTEVAAQPAVEGAEITGQTAESAERTADTVQTQAVFDVTEPGREAANSAFGAVETVVQPVAQTADAASQPVADLTGTAWGAAQSAPEAVGQSGDRTDAAGDPVIDLLAQLPEDVADVAEPVAFIPAPAVSSAVEEAEAVQEPVASLTGLDAGGGGPGSETIDSVAGVFGSTIEAVAGSTASLVTPSDPFMEPLAGAVQPPANRAQPLLEPVSFDLPGDLLQIPGSAIEAIDPVSERTTDAVMGLTEPLATASDPLEPFASADPSPASQAQPLPEPVETAVRSELLETAAPVEGAIAPISEWPAEGAAGVTEPLAARSDLLLETLRGGVRPPGSQASHPEAAQIGEGFVDGLGEALELAGTGMAFGGLAATLALLGFAAGSRLGFIVSSFASCLPPGAPALATRAAGPPNSHFVTTWDAQGNGGETSEAEAAGVKGHMSEQAGDASVSSEGVPVGMAPPHESRLLELVQYALLALSLALLALATLPKRVLRRVGHAAGVGPYDNPRPYLVAVGVSLPVGLYMVLLAA
jgi:hypothetical protein